MSYAVQLLQRSYFGIYGRGINEDYPKIVLRGPILNSGVEGNWENYL